MDDHRRGLGGLACPDWADGKQLSAPNGPVTNGMGFRGSFLSMPAPLKGSKGGYFQSSTEESSRESGGGQDRAVSIVLSSWGQVQDPQHRGKQLGGGWGLRWASGGSRPTDWPKQLLSSALADPRL